MVTPGHPIEPGLVSVIMSNFNTSRTYIREAINSVLTQTYPHLELIIIEDASTNNSPLEIVCYQDPRIRVFHNEENMGLAASLNRAMRHCRGEFIARMDTDDVCCPQRIERQVEFLREHPDVVVCGTWVEKVFETDAQKTSKKICTVLPADREEYRIYLLFGNSPTLEHPSAMFNHRLLKKYDIKYHAKYRYAQDYRMWVSCAKHAPCAIVPEVLLKFRRHSDSVSAAKRDRQIEYAYQIIQGQLDALHLTLPDDMKEFHRGLFKDRKPYDIRIKKWIEQMITANRKYKVYHQKKFERILWFGWVRVCYFALRESKGKKETLRILCSIPILRYPQLVSLYTKRKNHSKLQVKEENHG